MKLREIGEFGLINLINDFLREEQADDPRVTAGIGDDAAVVDSPKSGKLLFTTDTMVENVHFNTAYARAEDIGYKAMASNISDIAAMAGLPCYALVTLGLNSETDVEFVTALYKGITAAAQSRGVTVVGGDMTKSTKFFITICLVGTAEARLVRMRDMAQAGDAVMVTGNLGGSAAALKLLKEGFRPGRGMPQALYDKHMRPAPRVKEAQIAAAEGAHAIQDISDGLVSDLGHICEASSKGARIYLDKIPLFLNNRRMPRIPKPAAQKLALAGGEDYELIITAPISRFHKIKFEIESQTGTKVTMIGEITDAAGEVIVLGAEGTPVKRGKRGFDHFG